MYMCSIFGFLFDKKVCLKEKENKRKEKYLHKNTKHKLVFFFSEKKRGQLRARDDDSEALNSEPLDWMR